MTVHRHGLCLAAPDAVATGAFALARPERARRIFRSPANRIPRRGRGFAAKLELTGRGGQAGPVKRHEVQLP